VILRSRREYDVVYATGTRGELAMHMRRRFEKKPALPAARGGAGRRVAPHKLTKAEAANRRELVAGASALLGMRIDDVFPPSSQEQYLAPDGVWRLRESSRRSTREPRRFTSGSGRKGTMASARNNSTPRANRRDTPHDDAAVREAVRKAFISIRGMQIDDVYPASDGSCAST
jgi:hypothetical protein